VRTLIRLTLLGLAVFGAKTLYDKLAPRKDELRKSGQQFLDRTSGAARELSGKVGDATQSLVETAEDRGAELKAAAAEQANVVRSAADEFTTSVGAGTRPPTGR
jgi:hypothetical protein